MTNCAVQTIKDILRPYRDEYLTNRMLRRLREHQESNSRSAILIATPKHGNLGDQAIVLSEREFLQSSFPEYSIFEIQRFQYELAGDKIAQLIKPNDLIIIDGGGNVGTLWPEENNKMNDIVRRFNENPVVIFPQTAYFENSSVGDSCIEDTASAYKANPNLVFFSRDKATFNIIKEITPNTINIYVPDIVLYHSAPQHVIRSGALICLRNDKERTVDGDSYEFIESLFLDRGIGVKCTTTVVDRPKRIGEGNRVEALNKKWAEFGAAEIVVTDRLHGMIFSAITGTPCIALDNISHKVSQGYEWLRGSPNIKLAKSIDAIPGLIDEVLSHGPCTYDRAPLRSYHDSMREAILSVID